MSTARIGLVRERIDQAWAFVAATYRREEQMIDISRTYALKRDGSELPVVLRIFGSEKLDSSTWAVRFTISGLDERSAQPTVIYGADTIQAVLCALKVARAVLESDPHYRGGNLTLEGAAPEDPLGLSL